MQKISYRRTAFTPILSTEPFGSTYRFTMSFRDVEDLLAERGIDVSYETVRLWVLKFGQAYALSLLFIPSAPTNAISCKSWSYAYT